MNCISFEISIHLVYTYAIILFLADKTIIIVDLAILADHRVKLKENKRREKYLKAAREEKNYGT